MYSGSLCADEKGESRVNWGTKKVSLILTDMLYIYIYDNQKKCKRKINKERNYVKTQIWQYT